MTDTGPHEPIADGTSLKVTLGGQLRELQRWVIATPAIILAAIAIHVYASVDTSAGAWLDDDVAMRFGNFGAAVSQGEWWRVLTGMWLHGGTAHLVGNMIALAVIGYSVERMVGWRGFLVMYVLSGAGGALATDVVWPYAVSIGASGAVFGVFGCVVGFTLRYPGQFPSQGLSTLMWTGLAYAGYQVAFGTGPGINWVAHGAGFVAGGLCGAALSAPIEPHAVPGRLRRDARLALAGAAVVAAALLALAGRYPDLATVAGELFARDARIGERAAATAEGDDPAAIAAAIDGELLPAVRDARGYLASLDRMPREQRAFLEPFDRYLEARARAWAALSDGLARGDLDAAETARWLHASADGARDRLLERLAGADPEPPPGTPIAPLFDPALAALAALADR